MDWKWAENSILNNTSQYRPCKDIFQAVADELGRYYENKGLKYSHSFPKLVYKDSGIKLEILFASSHSNRKGDYVCFDIFPNFYSVDLKKIGNKGFILGHVDIFNRYDEINKHKYHFNVYNVTLDDFREIIALIDDVVLPWIEDIKTADGVNKMLKRKEGGFYGNSVFREYSELNFPELIIM